MGCISNPRIGEYQQIEIGEYSLFRQSKIADGAYGDIWKCQSCYSDSIFALKQIKLQSRQLDDMFKKQIHILEKMAKHKVKGSVALKSWSIEKGDPKASYKIGRLLFQLGTITLLDELSSKHFTDQQILVILKGISRSLQQIHQIGIYHLDLKPQNIILVNNQYKLCDFGSAIEAPIEFDKLDKRQKSNFVEYIEANCTLSYRSPQMIQSHGKVIGSPSDIWMLGCIAYLITFRKHPFQNEGQLAILSGNIIYPREGDITTLIKQLLNLSSNQRPTAQAIIDRIDISLNK